MKKSLKGIATVLAVSCTLPLCACGNTPVTDGDTITGENISSLVGKTVGVAQLNNVPGLTLQVVLNKYNIEYQIIESAQAPTASDKVNLVAVEAANATPASGCDYYLLPEPVASKKVAATKDNPVSFAFAGDLQKLYGAQNGYPQAVLVAKKEIAGDEVTGKLVSHLQSNAQYIASAQTAEMLSLLAGARESGLLPAFDENSLTQTVIQNCAVRYMSVAQNKSLVNAFLQELIAVNPDFTKLADDNFYYTGDFTANATASGARSLYVPDGAPALGILNALHENDADFNFNVVNAEKIASFVTGGSPVADYCILPLNAAAKLLGTGNNYRMLGTVTNGNLYFLTVKKA